MFIVAAILLFCSTILLAGGLFLLLEVIGSFFSRQGLSSGDQRELNIAVVIPAHNEENDIAGTIKHVLAQDAEGLRVVVVADNCTDQTGVVARDAGAEVIIRNDAERRGKGYALQAALDALRAAPPDVVFFLDADCRMSNGCVKQLSQGAADSGRPVQALYLMNAPEGAPPQRRVAAFAWLLINKVRMMGLYNVFGVCRLTGSGMAFPWTLAEKLELNTGHIVEDLSLTSSLTMKGHAAVFRPDCLVTSTFPTSDEAAAIQHARWEHGSFRVARDAIFPMLRAFFQRGDLKPLALAADLAIPPLAFFVMLHVVMVAATGLAFLWGVTAPFFLSVTSSLLVAASVVLAWAAYGRQTLPLSSLSVIASYLVGKRRVYDAKARRSTAVWTRTDRDAGGGK